MSLGSDGDGDGLDSPPMARVSYLPLPEDLRADEIEECPVARASFGSASTMFANLGYFTDEHLVVGGRRVARLQVDMHDETPRRIAVLLVCELEDGTVEIRRSPATDEPAAHAALRHIAAYAASLIRWT